MKYVIACLAFFGLALTPARAQFDYTPGFEPGAPEELSVYAALEGQWTIQLYYPAADADAAEGWRWAEWAEASSIFEPRLDGAVMLERNSGFPISPGSTGAEGYDRWRYDVWWSWDRFSNVYRASIVDNLWGFVDIYEGTNAFDVSNLDTSTFNRGGPGGRAQKSRLRITERGDNRFVLEWWTLDMDVRVEGADRDAQPWQPSVRMVYFQAE
ncbi:hypothetical protein [Maricaulis sp. MIT060901]|uniref:hypothetical protein n=1 Tax=Maricaulis sp. MIT060901 TaxID=3096993 RepID=UPI00399BA27E